MKPVSALACAVALAALLCLPAASATGPQLQLPAAGELLTSRAAVRATPIPQGRLVRVLHQLRGGHQFQVVLAVAARRATMGTRGTGSAFPDGRTGNAAGSVANCSTCTR